jgi:hypothetical protein
MKKTRVIILILLLTVVCACSPKGIIPKKKLARIHADMFLLDQYAGADRNMRRFTDTTAVYKAVLRSYGVTAEQYSASIDFYLDNSREMAEVLEMTEKILTKRKNKILKSIEKGARKQDTTLLLDRSKKPVRENFPPVDELKKE